MTKPVAINTVVLRRFESPDEIRSFEKGRLELVNVGPLVIGRATYEPGWKWSLHVGPTIGARYCVVEHVGMVVSGVATVAFEDGRVIELREGSLFHVPAVHTTAGSSGTVRTCRCTSWGRSGTPSEHRARCAAQQ